MWLIYIALQVEWQSFLGIIILYLLFAKSIQLKNRDRLFTFRDEYFLERYRRDGINS